VPAAAVRPARTGRTLSLVVAAALVAGASGGAVGAALSDDGRPPAASGTVATPASLDAAPAAPAEAISTVAARVLPSVVSIEVRSRAGSGSGSGVVLDEAGHILTNNHVVESGVQGEVRVVFSDGRRVPAQIVGRDATTDLAVLRVEGVDGLRPIALGRSADVAVGDAVVAIGSPLGLSGTVTTGIVSALDRTVPTTPEAPLLGAIQTDAAINPGNSGGALVDGEGRLIGINTAISSTSGGSIGLGFAIPIDQARSIAEELIRTGRATHPSLGVAATTVTSDDGTRGALLQQVAPGSAADDAGLREGDLVVSVGDEAVDSVDELILALRTAGVGERVSLGYLRDGDREGTDVVLQDRRA
jgi:putative serine protease PepD